MYFVRALIIVLAHFSPVWTLQRPNVDMKSLILKRLSGINPLSLYQNGKYHIHPKTIQGKNKGSLFKSEGCCTAQFHFPVR